MNDTPLPKWTSRYLLLRAAAVLIWWVLLLLRPEIRALYFDPAHDRLLLGLAVPDLAIFVVLSAVVGGQMELSRTARLRTREQIGNSQSPTGPSPALVVLAGSSVYAMLFAATLVWTTSTGWLGVACMLPMTGIDLFIVWRALR
jgi:hypothetical protein